VTDGAESFLDSHHPRCDLHDSVERVDLLMYERCGGFVGRPVRDAVVQPVAERLGLCECRPHVEQGRVVEMAIVERAELGARFDELLDSRSFGSGAGRYSRKGRVGGDARALTRCKARAMMTTDPKAVPRLPPALPPLAVSPRTRLAARCSLRMSTRRWKPRFKPYTMKRTCWAPRFARRTFRVGGTRCVSHRTLPTRGVSRRRDHKPPPPLPATPTTTTKISQPRSQTIAPVPEAERSPRRILTQAGKPGDLCHFPRSDLGAEGILVQGNKKKKVRGKPR
jgi:hypothetical protein